MSPRHARIVLVLAGLIWVGEPLAADDAQRPNIVVFLADDQGWGDLSLHGNPNFQTPHIDSLARDGLHLPNFYVCPVCAPTRAEFLTGRYHPRGRVHGVTRGAERMDATEITIAELLRDAGYATAAFGKWHNGMQWPYHPNAQGFEEYYGFCSGHWGNYFSPMLEHNGEITKGNGFLVDDLTDHAIEFIDAHQDKRFFVYLPYNTPHSPMQVPERFWDEVDVENPVRDPNPENAKREDATFTRAALAMCKNIDWNVGRVLEHLDRLNLADDTVVIYFSDNGPNSYRFNAGMRGRKGSTYEGGVRSPMVMRYPSRVKPGTESQVIAGAVDLLPTLCDLAGIEPPTERPLDGISLRPIVDGDQTPENLRDRALITHWNGRLSVRHGDHRYHHDGTLYDLASDPDESDNVAESNPEIVQKLQAELDGYVEQVQPIRGRDDDRPFVVGHPGSLTTQLPARDGESHDGVTRSNRHANCTFFENWTNTDGRITWEVHVAEPGRYEVDMHYAVDDQDAGSTITLVAKDASLSATISEPNEVPLFGEEDDRTPRIEGYVKRWKPMRLGVIDLQSGPQTFTLQATDVPGDEVCQMRLLMLRKVPRKD